LKLEAERFDRGRQMKVREKSQVERAVKGNAQPEWVAGEREMQRRSVVGKGRAMIDFF